MIFTISLGSAPLSPESLLVEVVAKNVTVPFALTSPVRLRKPIVVSSKSQPETRCRSLRSDPPAGCSRATKFADAARRRAHTVGRSLPDAGDCMRALRQARDLQCGAAHGTA